MTRPSSHHHKCVCCTGPLQCVVLYRYLLHWWVRGCYRSVCVGSDRRRNPPSTETRTTSRTTLLSQDRPARYSPGIRQVNHDRRQGRSSPLVLRSSADGCGNLWRNSESSSTRSPMMTSQRLTLSPPASSGAPQRGYRSRRLLCHRWGRSVSPPFCVRSAARGDRAGELGTCSASSAPDEPRLVSRLQASRVSKVCSSSPLDTPPGYRPCTPVHILGSCCHSRRCGPLSERLPRTRCCTWSRSPTGTRRSVEDRKPLHCKTSRPCLGRRRHGRRVGVRGYCRNAGAAQSLYRRLCCTVPMTTRASSLHFLSS